MVRAFSRSFSPPNDALPMRAWTMPAFSTRNSTRPALSSRTALATSVVTVPDLGVRHQALGAEHAAEPADQAHHVRGGDHRVEVDPALLLDLLDQVLGADDSPRPRPGPRWPCRPWRRRPRAGSCRCRGAARPRRGPSDRRASGSTPEAHRDVDALVELRDLGLGDELAGLVDRIALGAIDLGRRVLELLSVLRPMAFHSVTSEPCR